MNAEKQKSICLIAVGFTAYMMLSFQIPIIEYIRATLMSFAMCFIVKGASYFDKTP